MLVTALLACLIAVGLPSPAGATEAAAEASMRGQVVVIGVPGLRWDDLDPVNTPTLWDLAARGGTASLSTRTIPSEGYSITCPVAGWLTVSAGQRAGAARPADRHRACGAAPTPVMAGDGSGSATIPNWPEFVAFQKSSSYRARIGLLGQTIDAAGGKIAAIGPGAALAAADESGKVQKYAATAAELPDLTPYTAVFAEADQITREWLARQGADLPPDVRRSAVAAADRTVRDVLSRVSPSAPSAPETTAAGTTVLVAGLSDADATAHLHVAIATGTGAPGPYGRGWLTASSTRQDALVTITDLTATVLRVLGLQTPKEVVGKPWRGGDDAPDGTLGDTGEAVARLADADLAGQVLRQVREPFFIALVAVQLLFYGLAAVVVRGRRRRLASVQAVAVVSGALPISAFLAQLVPWWSFAHPMPALIGTILAFAGLIAGLAFAGPWRGHVLGPLTVVAAVSSLALLVDVMTGSSLQVNAVSGYEPVTGGRFYGFGNMAYAVYSTGTILLLAGVAHALRRRRRVAVAGCLAYGLLAIVADGWPGWGADFGGVPSFVLGVAVFLLLFTGRRVSAARLAIIALAGAGLIGLIAVADWLRPADRRTHLGAFVQQVIDGEGGSVIGRKLAAMLHTLGNLPLTLLSLAALAFLFLVLSRPSRWGASALSQAYGMAPELRAGLFGALTAALAGFLLNDSGIAIPAMALTVAVPLTLAASVRALRLAAAEPSPTPGPADRSSTRAGSPAPPAT
ncbi:hypothetical protein Mth01_54690 [Sphaerimonospora thailandensis]|uniref:Uncharacterized protein n=1 Tax=Sphaerimonospora thailandensis TaxID=795644 RepID=A0A8J3W2W0_9ACTN|nr:hypothetical protein Mth01_54690 [Sphaerimonospora thailandensis]